MSDNWPMLGMKGFSNTKTELGPVSVKDEDLEERIKLEVDPSESALKKSKLDVDYSDLDSAAKELMAIHNYAFPAVYCAQKIELPPETPAKRGFFDAGVDGKSPADVAGEGRSVDAIQAAISIVKNKLMETAGNYNSLTDLHGWELLLLLLDRESRSNQEKLFSKVLERVKEDKTRTSVCSAVSSLIKAHLKDGKVTKMEIYLSS